MSGTSVTTRLRPGPVRAGYALRAPSGSSALPGSWSGGRAPGTPGSSARAAYKLGPGVYARAPSSLQAAYPTYEFGLHSPETGAEGEKWLVNWMYLRIDSEAAADRCPGAADYGWEGEVSSVGENWVVSASMPFVTYEIESAGYGTTPCGTGAPTPKRVRLWAGVAHWVRELGTSLTLWTETPGGWVGAVMWSVSEVRAWVRWPANPSLHPNSGCDAGATLPEDRYIQFEQAFPCGRMEVWSEIDAGGGSEQLPDAAVYGMHGGSYVTYGDEGWLGVARPALAFAGEPVGVGGGLFSVLGRMVKAVVELPSHSASGTAYSDEELAQTAFECVFGGEFAAGVGIDFVVAEGEGENTGRARRCLTARHLQPLDQVLEFIREFEDEAPWIAHDQDAQFIEADRDG